MKYATYKQHNLHCQECQKHSGKVARYKLIFKFRGSDNVWEETFPCIESVRSMSETLKPFTDICKYERM